MPDDRDITADHDTSGTVEDVGEATYRLLTGRLPVEAVFEDDLSFDAHVLASILAVAASEGTNLAERAGLSGNELKTLMARYFPAAELSGADQKIDVPGPNDDEVIMVRDLLLKHLSSEGDSGAWLAAMMARRAMEPNHLWEDLGLRDRSELTRLLATHFSSLSTRNTKNMRWKRFFYRMLCEDDGFVMCSTPVCTQCADFDLCFGEESGESRLAAGRRALAPQLT